MGWGDLMAEEGAALGDADIRSRFRQLAARDHPDKNPDDLTAADRFKELVTARDLLLDPKM
eukprot:1794925-Lingulodinium_polyedra.AAC.1